MKLIKIFIAVLLASSSLAGLADNVAAPETQYRRSSICSFLVSRTDQKLYDRIQEKFLEIPTPSQYNNHDLSVRIINVDKKGKYTDSISNWLVDNNIASRVVGRWFDRNILTGECSLDLVKNRGLYNATELDKELARRSARGLAMLEDAGEDLIGNTFVLVHEAQYIDNENRSKNVATGLRIVGSLAGAFLGSGVSDLFDTFASVAETFKGFRVKIHSHLYQLVWDDETTGTFYKDFYSDKPDPIKRDNFDASRDKFKLKYIGDVESAGSQNSFLGISEEHPEIMIRKACQRAIDDNIADLQREFDVFKVRSPILAVDGNDVHIAIGMKEGVNENSEYEVLEPRDKNGKIEYKRIGVIMPVKDKIWDNRFMAKEEGALGSDLNYTTFAVKSGSKPYEGLLVRQLK